MLKIAVPTTGQAIEAKDYKEAYTLIKKGVSPTASDAFFRTLLGLKVQRNFSFTPPALIIMIMVAEGLFRAVLPESTPLMSNQPAVNGAKLKANRERLGHSQPVIGFLFGYYTGEVIDYSTVSAHETGRRTVSTVQAETYAKIYNVPVTALYGD